MRCVNYVLSFAVLGVALLMTDVCFGEQQSIDSEERSLGTVDFAVSCSPAVQNQFNRGVALLHHMMYSQAEEEFKKIAARDPNCAMANWGIGMTLFHPLWAPPSKEELERGKTVIDKAKSLGSSSDREQKYLTAAGAFYENWQKLDHRTRIAAWEAGQNELFIAYPDDIDAGALYALAHLATAPKGDKTYSHQKKAGALLEKMHARAPEHPALFHYTIHAYDNPLLAGRGVEVARGYDKLAPDVPHALHMPSHIFVRLGMWPEAIDWNRRSAAAARRQSADGNISLHYIHAMDYLMYAYLQEARDQKALEVLKEINGIDRYQDSFASAYGIAAAQARYPLERLQWAAAAMLPVRTHKTFPWDKYPWHEAVIYFARGLGAARTLDITGARNALQTLNQYYERTVQAGQDYWAVLVDAQRLTVAAWLDYFEGKKDRALEIMGAAADLEDSVDKHPVTPGAVLPARELLGDMLVLTGKPEEALQAYETSLQAAPNRFNSLYGAGYAAQLSGDIQKAKKYYIMLVQLAADSEGDRPRLVQAQTFLDRN